MYRHILVPTDGSELAQKGVNHALALAKGLGSKVTIITATEPFPIMYGDAWVPNPEDYDRFADENRKAASELLERIRTEAAKLGVQADIEYIPDQNAASAIIDAAQRLICDLIVMSSHGRRGIKRALLGSQTSEVLGHSSIPVLVVR